MIIEKINSLLENFGIISFKLSRLPFLDLFIVFRVIKENNIFKVVKLPVKIKDSFRDIFVIDEARTADWEGPTAGRNVENKEHNKVLVLIDDRRNKAKKYYYELAEKSINNKFKFTGKKIGEYSKTKTEAIKFAKSWMRKHPMRPMP